MVHTCHSVKVTAFLPPCGALGSHEEPQAWQQVPLSVEPSCPPSTLFLEIGSFIGQQTSRIGLFPLHPGLPALDLQTCGPFYVGASSQAQIFTPAQKDFYLLNLSPADCIELPGVCVSHILCSSEAAPLCHPSRAAQSLTSPEYIILGLS